MRLWFGELPALSISNHGTTCPDLRLPYPALCLEEGPGHRRLLSRSTISSQLFASDLLRLGERQAGAVSWWRGSAYMVRIFKAAAEQCVGMSGCYRWVLMTSDSETPHSRSDHTYPTEEAALSDGDALAAALNVALGHGIPPRKDTRRLGPGRRP